MSFNNSPSKTCDKAQKKPERNETLFSVNRYNLRLYRRPKKITLVALAGMEWERILILIPLVKKLQKKCANWLCISFAYLHEDNGAGA
jgi:hypothetical protein